MPRKVSATPEFKESLVDDAQASEGSRALDVQNQVMTEQETRTFELARQLGYEGALTVGGLEDEIRFYQQQTVDNWIAVGKRLLLLKDMTPHGEFEKRRALLGFSSQSCSRFISSALKIRKSPKLGDLAERAKNMSAFMELITLDDGVIDNLAELDEFDKMSPSQLRDAARKIKERAEDAEKRSAEKTQAIEDLQTRIKKAKPDAVLIELQKEATTLMNDALGCVKGQIRKACIALRNHAEAHQSGDQDVFMAGLLGQIQIELSAVRDEFNLPDVSNAADLVRAAEVAQWK